MNNKNTLEKNNFENVPNTNLDFDFDFAMCHESYLCRHC